jgi:hypothetical protein
MMKNLLSTIRFPRATLTVTFEDVVARLVRMEM